MKEIDRNYDQDCIKTLDIKYIPISRQFLVKYGNTPIVSKINIYAFSANMLAAHINDGEKSYWVDIEYFNSKYVFLDWV